MSEQIEQIPQVPVTPRKRLAEIVGEEIQNQRDTQADIYNEAAQADPAFDKKSMTSNFGKRVAARIQTAQ